MTLEQALLQTMAELQIRINVLQQRMGQMSEENKALAAELDELRRESKS